MSKETEKKKDREPVDPKVVAWIENAITETGLSYRDLEDLFGVVHTTVRGKVKRGQKMWVEDANKLATIFDEDKRAEFYRVMKLRDPRLKETTIPIIGEVSCRTWTVQRRKGYLPWLGTPPAGMSAITHAQDEIFKDVIYYFQRHTGKVNPSFIGSTCVVEIEGGPMMVGVLRFDQEVPGSYGLDFWTPDEIGRASVKNVYLKSASPVEFKREFKS